MFYIRNVIMAYYKMKKIQELIEQANQESTAIMRTLRFYQPEPPPNVINGEISQNDPYLIVDSENDQYTFEPFAKEEIERMEK